MLTLRLARDQARYTGTLGLQSLKRQTLFPPLRGAHARCEAAACHDAGSTSRPALAKCCCGAATQLRNRAGNVDLGSYEPQSPSPLRRNSTPVDGDELDEEVDYIGQGAQST